jgi:secretion/DNA translocation related TadE-like protein
MTLPAQRPVGDAGVATVAALALSTALAGAGVGAMLVGDAVVTRHRAAAAADLAALAAAAHVLGGPRAACAAARTVATVDGARLTACAVDGSVVRVVTAVAFAGPLGRFGSAHASAVAGPATPDATLAH